MTLTGQAFDLDPKTFTLANMFSMHLHKYKDEIAKVTSCALKELTIENEIKKLAETWQEQRFDLHKYHSVSFVGSTCGVPAPAGTWDMFWLSPCAGG